MANCKEEHVIGSQAYKDCLERNKKEAVVPISETVLGSININTTKGDKEISTTDYLRLNEDYKLGEGVGVGGKIKNFLGAIDISPITTVEPSEDITTDAGFFGTGQQEGLNNLNNLFEGIDGLTAESGGKDRSAKSKDELFGVKLVYKDKEGNVKKSDNIRFYHEGSGVPGSDAINSNIDIMSSFLNENVDLSEEELSQFLKNREQKIKTQRKIEQDFLDSRVVNKINKEYDSPDLFKPKTGKVRGIVSSFNLLELPYEDEIKKEISIINQKITAGTLPSVKEGEIIKQARENVREVLKVEAVTKAKKLFYSDRSNKGLDQQSDDFIGSLLLAKSNENDLEDNSATIAVINNDQETNVSALELGAGILSGKNTDPEAKKVFLKMAANLGIEKPETGFVGAVTQGEGDNTKWDITTQKEFVAAGSPDEMEEVTLTNGVKTTRTILNLQKQLFNNYNARKVVYDNAVEERTDLIMKLNSADLINDIASKSYDDFTANIQSSLSMGKDLLVGGGYLTSKILNTSLKYNQFTGSTKSLKYLESDNLLDKELDKYYFKYKENSIALQNRLRDKVDFDDAFTNPLSFGKFLLEESFVQLPILLAYAFTGGAGAFVMGASGKFGDMKYSNYTGDSNYSFTDRLWMPAAYGLAEGVFAQLSTIPILKRFNKRFKGSTGQSDLLQQGRKEWVKDNWKRAIVYDPLLEWGAESLTQGSQNLIDGKPFLENMDHAGFSGFSISLMMGASSFGVGAYQSSFSSFDQRQKIRAKQLEISSLGVEYNNLDKRTKEAKIIEEQIKQANKELDIEIENSNEISNNNIREGFASGFITMISMQSKLQADARVIVDSKTLTEGYKKEALAKLEKLYNNIEYRKSAALETSNLMKYRPEFALLETTDSEKYNNIIIEARQDLEGTLDGKEPTPEQIKRQGYEVYLKRKIIESNKQAGAAGVKLNTYSTRIEALIALDNDNLSDAEKAKARANIMNGADGWASPNGTTNVIVENQIVNQNKFTAVHEIGHKVFWKIFENNEQAFKPIADQLLSDIQNYNGDIYEEFINSIERGADGNLLSQEVIMKFLEFSADGKIGNNNTIKGMFGAIIQKVFKKDYNFDFKGEKDINTFVTELGKKIKDGTLSKEDIQAASENTGITTLTPSNVSGMISSEKSSGVSLSKGDGFANGNVASDLNLTDSTKDIVEKNNKVFDEIIELSKLPENKGVPLKDLVTQKMKDVLVTNNMPRVTALAKQAAKAGQNINLEESLRKTYDDFNGEYALKLTELANSWNPAKNDSFGAYMNQLLPKKYSGILAKLKKGESDQTTRIDESTTQIADVSTSSSVDTVVEPKIDPLTFLPEGEAKNKFVKSLNNALKNATPEQLKNISFANPITSDKLLNEFADIFGLLTTGRDGQVRNPLIDKSFNFSNVQNLKNVQRQIIKNYQNLRNAMPQGNETVFTRQGRQGPVKEGGGSLGLTTKFLNEYYTRLPKKISNNVQYRPKPLSKNDWLAPLGIIDGKVDPNYTPRAGEAQTLKGMFDAMYKNVASQAADAQLEIDQQLDTDARARAKANVRSGKSGLVFNLNGKKQKQIQDFAQAQNENLNKTFRAYGFEIKVDEYSSSDRSIDTRIASGKYFGYDKKGKFYIDEEATGGLGVSKDTIFIKDQNFKDARSRWIKKIAPLLSPDMLEASLIAGGPRSFFGTLDDVYIALGMDIKNKSAKQKKDEASEFFNKSAPKIPTNFDYSRGKYANMSPDQLRDHFNSKEFKANEALKMPFLEDFNKVMELTMKNEDGSINKEVEAMWAGFLSATSSMSSGIIRRMAPIKFFSLIAQQKGNLFVEEHSMPANNIAKTLFWNAKNGKVTQNFSFIEDNYFQGQLRKKDDNKLKAPWFNYISSMPPEFFTMENLTTWIRYNNENVAAVDGGIDFDTYEMVNTGITVTKELAQQAMDIVVVHIDKQKILNEGIIANKGVNPLFLSAAPKKLSNEFNTIIEQTLGIEADKRFSDVVAKRRGARKGKFRPFVPPSMEDFQGLMYDVYGYGVQGEQQMKWVLDNLIKPYQKGIANIDIYRQTLKEDYKALLKKFPNVKKNLGKTVSGTDFTYDQAIRVSLWSKAGYEIPGISRRDVKKLNDFIDKNPELGLFADGAVLVSKQNQWSKPDPYWDVQSILSDMNSFTDNVGRQQFLEEFVANSEAIFSNENLNKLEAGLGSNWRSAMEDSLYRMRMGSNRPTGLDKLTNKFLNWTNNSIGAIMFFNRKSALLQTISSVNFLNWSDNNPVKAAMAFANFPQFIKDFAFLWNSPKLKQRRAGLKGDVNEAEIANAVRGATNKAQAMLSYLLKLGFTPTQLADSFAIASGGATFYRNRLNTYKKDGLTDEQAQVKAFEDFSSTSEVSQQSADPMYISQQQAGLLGRLILAFQNTPAQVTRLFKKAGRDFKNNRGDQKTNMSKIVYYGAIQGLIFATLQNAYFMMADDETEDQNAALKQSRILHSMTDTLLRGSGVYGAIVATLKNTAVKYFQQKEKSAFAKDNGAVILEIANLSPPLGSKLRKINNAMKTEDYKKDVMDKMNWDVTYKGKVILSPKYNVISSVVEGATNIPLERAMNEFLALSEMMDQRNSTMQRIALALGYRSWDVGAKIEEFDEINIEAKEERGRLSKQRAQDKRDEKKRIKEAKKYEGKTEKQIAYIKRYDIIMKQRKPEQVAELSKLGLTSKQIKALKYERDRVKKIIELQNKQ